MPLNLAQIGQVLGAALATGGHTRREHGKHCQVESVFIDVVTVCEYVIPCLRHTWNHSMAYDAYGRSNEHIDHSL